MPQIIKNLNDSERLMRAGDFRSAAEVLEGVIQQTPTLEAFFMLGTSYLKLGQHEKALRHAMAALDLNGSAVPVRDLLAKVHLALGQLDSALPEFLALAALRRQQQSPPLAQTSIPAHFALHNIEQLEYILEANADRAEATKEELEVLRRGLTDAIVEAEGKAPRVPISDKSSRLLVDPPYVRVDEERLPRYLNPGVDYHSIQHGILAGKRVQVIDEFLTPDALDQVRKFCLQSTVWRHPYKFGYVGAFPQDGFASVSLFAFVDEFLAALGDAFEGFQLAQWWGFVYDSRLPGTDIHDDGADFSLNLWITPDSANLDPDSGGMVLWDKTVPSDWTSSDNFRREQVDSYLREQNAHAQVVPYRSNRAVLFESHLFHRTDKFSFAPGFVNRRRSLTFLFCRS